MILDRQWASEEDLKAIEKDIRKRIDSEVEQIRKDPFPTEKDLYTHIGVTKEHYIRGVTMEQTIHIPE